jgi:PKD repeat protein
MRRQTLLLWSAAGTAVLLSVVALLLTLPLAPAKANHIPGHEPDHIDLTVQPPFIYNQSQGHTFAYDGTPSSKLIGPNLKKNMRGCGCYLAALATVASTMLPLHSQKLWPVLRDPRPTDPTKPGIYTQLSAGYLHDYFRNGHTVEGAYFDQNWGYTAKLTPAEAGDECGIPATGFALEHLIQPQIVTDGSGNEFEHGKTGLTMMEVSGKDGAGVFDAKLKALVRKWVAGEAQAGGPAPVLVGYHYRNRDGSITGWNHTNIIVGYTNSGKFLVLDPSAIRNGGASQYPTQPAPWYKSGYDQWEEDIWQVWFPMTVQAETFFYHFRDDPAPIDMLTISPDGSRTGTDGTTGVKYAEDPDVSVREFGNSLDIDMLTSESSLPPPSAPLSKDVTVRGPREGPYRIQAVGQAAGQLRLDFIDVKSSSLGTDQNTVLSIDRPIAAGEVQKFEMGHSGNNPATAEAVSSFTPEARAGNDTNGLTGVGVPFKGEGSFDYDGTISEYAWEFGDGSSALGAAPTHAYSQPGTYTAKLTITDDAGRTATDTLTVTIELSQQKPVARLTGPYLATATRDVFLSSTESFDRNNDPLTYKWDFGDGTTATSDSFNGVNHAYAEPGDYEVTLIVNDGKEDSLPAKSSVKVLANEPEGISVPECVTPGSTVSVSIDNELQMSYSWDIGYNGPMPEPPTVTYVQEQINRTETAYGGEYGRPTGFGSPLKVESVQAVSELASTLNMTWQVPQNYTPGEHTVGFNQEGSDMFWKSITSPCPVPENQAPLAHAGGPSYNASAGRPITLDGSQSSDPDGDPLTYTWDLGENPIGGDNPIATGVRPTHTFSAPGRYYLQLSVNDGTDSSPLGRDSFAVVDVADAPPPPDCTIGEIEPPVNDVSSADDPAMSAYKFGSRGVIPAKFKAACDANPIDTQAEADAHPMKLTLTKLGSTPDQDAVVENTETGSANTGDLFRFDDADDHYIYNVGVKNLTRGTYKLTISEANGGGSHDEWFSIR